MFKVFKYSIYEMMRSRWIIVYCIFYLLVTSGLLYLSFDPSKVILSLMNILLILSPLIACMFTVMYYYNSREFTELLVAQPIRRRHIFAGQFLGITSSLALCILFGIGIPFLFFGGKTMANLGSLLSLILIGILLTLVFCAVSFYIALRNENRIRGFSYALLFWLFFAVIYDGIFLILLMAFRDYPLDNLAISATVFNPIDLSRIFLMLQMETSALMGYTGAVFKKFFQAELGMIISFAVLSLWIIIPVILFLRKSERKDF